MRICAVVLLNILGLLSAYDGIDWEPQYPVNGGKVVIYYDLNTRNILPPETNPVYLHLGFDNWNNTADYTMSKNDSDIWEYELDIPENILVIDFAFTNNIDDYEEGEWDNNGGIGIDFHIDVYAEGLSIVVLSPEVDNPYNNIYRTPEIIAHDAVLPIRFTTVTTGAPFDSLYLNINGSGIFSTHLDTLNYYFSPTNWATDRFEIDCIGKDVNGIKDTTTFAIIVQPDQSNEKPPAEITPGVDRFGDKGISFMLFAPEKEHVYLIGDINNWEVNNDYLLNQYEVSADSILWWLSIPNNFSNLKFQYLVDGEIRIADPFSELVLDPWNDSHITSSTYPNLPEYPAGKTSYPVSYLDLELELYNWQNTDYSVPETEELVIYEMLIRDFIENRDYKTLIDTLDYLENLGINAIEFMPINEFEGNSSWGYNPSFYFALDKYYGPQNDLKAFIDECHRRGIAVIQDIVLNHSYGQSPLVRLYWDEVDNRPAANNPWYNTKSPNPVFSWGYDFNHESEHTRYFSDRVLRYWIEEYKIDGFRLDFTKGMTNRGGDGSAYDASRIAILKRIANEVWSYAPSTYLILEHFADNIEEKELANYKQGFLLWGKATNEYNQASMGYSSGSDFSNGFYTKRGWSKPHLVTYMESHDEERMMFKNLQFGNFSGNYNVKDFDTAIDRQKLAAVFFFTLPGPKMIWQFGELGYDYSINYPSNTDGDRLTPKPIRWDYFAEPKRRELYDLYSQLINMRLDNDVFTSPYTSVDMSLNNSNGLKRIRLSGSTNVIVIGNFGVITQSIDPHFFYSGKWYYNFNADSVDIIDTNALIELEPGEFRIYTSKYLFLDTEDYNDLGAAPSTFSLSQNFPNPFNPVTTIEYSLPSESPVQLTIYNINGQAVEHLVDDILPAGIHNINWNASQLTSGIYFYRLTTEEFAETKKMLLIK